MSTSGLAAISSISTKVGGGPGLLMLGILGVALAGLAVIAIKTVRPSLLATIALDLTVFSGNWKYMHIPFGLDDVVMAMAIAAAVYRAWSSRHPERFTLRPIHLVLALMITYAVISALWSGTLSNKSDLFEILTSLGVVPYALFALAPVIFGTPRDRVILLWGLFALGVYLGIGALGETLHIHTLVLPKYILNPSLGIHNDRVRGPFLEASPEGFALFSTAFAVAWVGLRTRRLVLRAFCAIIVLFCLIGTFGTVTRAVWIGCAAAVLFTMVWHPRLRRYAVPGILGIAVVVLVVMALVPGLSSLASSRASDQRPVWDRLNSDRAALRLFEANALFGSGWGTYGVKSIPYYQEANSYPLTYVGVVHNVYLSQFAELGLLGGGLWLIANLLAIGDALKGSRARDLASWRMFAFAAVINWTINAAFVPLVYVMPNALMWALLGIAALPSPDTAPTTFPAQIPVPVPVELPMEPVAT
ncbi:MAG TPA: O-antigen ligase family protein [Solirubrobacteraceae bacterium]|nr:O-antigen ligase family protein [Solirubrobacteraceae bacterium]